MLWIIAFHYITYTPPANDEPPKDSVHLTHPLITPTPVVTENCKIIHQVLEYTTDTPLKILKKRLNDAYQQPVHILYYGDSQIEGDRITDILRKKLQKKYSGKGIGLIAPERIYLKRQNLIATSSHNWIKRGLNQPEIYDTGITGRCFHLAKQDSGQTKGNVMLKSFNKRHSLNASRLTIFYQTSTEAELRMTTNSQNSYNFQFDKNTLINKKSFKLDSTLRKLQLELSADENFTCFGISLTDSTGIYVNNLPLRGAAYPKLERLNIDRTQYLFNELNIGLVVIHFGVNIAPDRKDDYSGYTRAFARQINFLKKIDPQVPVLIVGVSDMAQKLDGKWQSYSNLDMITKAQRSAALNNNALFWDLRAAMGGKNSIIKWQSSQPPLGSKDYIHFSRHGADSVGCMLYHAIEYQLEKIN